jgi:hypothetical protein
MGIAAAKMRANKKPKSLSGWAMKRLLSCLALLITLGAPLLAGSEAPGQDQVPPMPQPPDVSGLPQQEVIKATAQWSTEFGKWFGSLTPEQRAAEQEREGRLPRPGDGYNWRGVAISLRLSNPDIERLGAKKLLIGHREFKQSFQPYTSHSLPVFITSDSMLNAFQLLFEDSFRELEIQRGPQLRRHLEADFDRIRALLKDPPFPRSDLEPGWLQAQRAAGPALVLLGTPLSYFDDGVRGEILAQVRQIRQASGVALPDWLAPATRSFVAIDYGRMKPVGFYSENARLADYFRAVRWLQLVPFRVERDNEFTAMALLGYGAKGGLPAAGSIFTGSTDFFSEFENIVGPADANSITDAENLRLTRELAGHQPKPTWAEALSLQRHDLELRRERVNDELRSQPLSADSAAQASFRVLAAAALPDAELFQTLADRGEPVSGLHVAALVGSSWAESRLPLRKSAVMADALQSERKHIRPLLEKTPVYIDYLNVVGSLFLAPDPNAPSFMGSDAWAAKSCQTALAGWVQMRHTFTLQAKLAVNTAGLETVPPGFIEPNPEFLRRFDEFISHTQDRLAEQGLFFRTPDSIAAALLDRADALDRLETEIPSASAAGKTYGRWFWELMALTGPDYDGRLPSDEGIDLWSRKVAFASVRVERTNLKILLPGFSAYLRDLAARYESGELKPAPIQSYAGGESLSKRWSTLRETSSRLETLLQKQLRLRPWDGEEANFIKDYGSTIASVMGYFGNKYIPSDDAPRWVEVMNDPQEGNSLVAAIGRPRVIYVLYPWDGMEILCQGSVMPYYELHSSERLTDLEWRDQLDSKPAPSQPEWMQACPEQSLVR